MHFFGGELSSTGVLQGEGKVAAFGQVGLQLKLMFPIVLLVVVLQFNRKRGQADGSAIVAHFPRGGVKWVFLDGISFYNTTPGVQIVG